MSGVVLDRVKSKLPAVVSPPQRKIKVFILEDEPVASQFYADLLEAVDRRFQVFKFVDGDDAWAELTKVDPDIFITDIVHPGLDGWEMLKLLAAEKVAYPILVVTGDSQSIGLYKSVYPDLKLELLGKPFRIQSFYKLLAALLGDQNGFLTPDRRIASPSRNGGPAMVS